MPSDTNVSAFAAYQAANVNSNNSAARKKRASGRRDSFELDTNLADQLRKYVKKSKKASRSKSKERSKKQQDVRTNGHSENGDKHAKISKKKVKPTESEPTLNLTNDFKAPPTQGTSTPTARNGVSRRRQLQTGSISDPPSHIVENSNRMKINTDATSQQSRSTDIEKLRAEGSVAVAKYHLQWIINPVSIDDFKQQYWEKAPVCVNRSVPKYYSQLMSTKTIDEILRNNMIEYTKNIDITSYENGERKTHNPEGRATPPGVWDFYRDGCSIRLLNPQTFIPQIHELNSILQEYFHCMTGANVYLTPPNSQGFAPHYDDIEAFVLQIEGKKFWRLYAPRNDAEYLPRTSSGNFRPDEIGEPIMERVLEPGDLLFFPRGTIHQAHTVPGHHSLHITLSVYQKTSYGDLLETLLPRALERAIDSDVELRRGLPMNIWSTFGLVNQDEDPNQRSQIITHIKNLFQRVINHLDVDEAVDQMALKYQHDALPPAIMPDEAPLTMYGNKCKVAANGEIDGFEFRPETRIRLLRKNILRLIEHEDAYRVYFYTDNSKEYHEFEPNFMEIDGEMAPGIEYLIKAYPEYVPVDDLPLDDQLALDVALELWNHGMIMLDQPAQ